MFLFIYKVKYEKPNQILFTNLMFNLLTRNKRGVLIRHTDEHLCVEIKGFRERERKLVFYW